MTTSLLELLAVLHRQLDREQAHLGIVGVDVEDRRVDHLRDVGAVRRAARVARVEVVKPIWLLTTRWIVPPVR